MLQTDFRHGEVLECEGEDETFLVVFHGVFPNGALVSPSDTPGDAFFVKLSELRRAPPVDNDPSRDLDRPSD